MVKKLHVSANSLAENQLAGAIKESASSIWLAGLGAFAKAQEEGNKVFEALVKEGSNLQMRSKSFTEERIGAMTGKVSKAAGDVAKQASQSWDKLEGVFESRVARALSRLGVPTNKDIQALIARVEQLNESVQKLGGKPVTRRSTRTTKAVAAVAAKAGKATKKAAKTAVKRARKAIV